VGDSLDARAALSREVLEANGEGLWRLDGHGRELARDDTT